MLFHKKKLNKNIILTFFCAFGLTLRSTATETQTIESSLTHVANLLNKSLNLGNQETKVLNKKQKLSLQIQKPSRDQMISIAMHQVTKLPEKSSDQKTFLDRLFLKKMELLCGEENTQQSLLSILNNTDTIFGTVALAKQLTEPTFNNDVINKVQTIVRTLTNDETLANKIQHQLDIIKTAEPYFFSYFQDTNPINEELLKKVYWGSRLNFLNSNEWTLELGIRLSSLGKLFSTSAIPCVLASTVATTKQIKCNLTKEPVPSFSKAFFLSLKGLVDPRPDAYTHEGLEGRTQDIGNNFSKLQELSERFNKSSEKERLQLAQQLQDENLKFIGSLFNVIPQTAGDVAHLVNSIQGTPKYVAMGVIGTLLGLQTYITYTALQDAIVKQTIYNYLQTKMIAVASYIHAIQELASIVKNSDLYLLIPNIESIETLEAPELSSRSPDCQKLLRLLDRNTFSGDASIFSLTGRVLKAHLLMEKVKEEFVPSCTFAGQLDAYLSTAKLYKKYEKSPAQFCFVTFEHFSKKPFVVADKFWNPFINAEQVILNSVELGIENPNNIILTGPNTGGKSTVIKGLLINILLAQTLTIAPAKTLTITPFAHLNCYLNITDDLTAGTSLFKAEVLRAKTLINAIRGLKENEFSFTIIDEIFSGTSPQEGEEAAVQFAQELSSSKNSLCTVATHFPRLTQELSIDAFKNYRVTVYKDLEGNWIRPFTLEHGISNVNIAMDLLREEGIFNT